jgi:hypothetical protein
MEYLRLRTYRAMMGALLACAGWAGCVQDGASPESRDAAGVEGIGLGASGPEVERVHEYLRSYGYFPNPELARAHPDWRPVVPEAPAELDRFDVTTEEALYAFQRIFGLEETGRIDAATRSAMAKPRCGVPDVAPDEDDKWAQLGHRWNRSPLFVSYDSSGAPRVPAGGSQSESVNSAISTWDRVSGFELYKMLLGPGDIRITWAALAGQTAGTTRVDAPNGIARSVTIQMNSALQVGWNYFDYLDPAWTGDSADFESAVLHELGHALGLHHSSVFYPVMYAVGVTGIQERDLYLDDVQGIHSLKAGHHLIPAPDASNTSTGIVCYDAPDQTASDEIWALGGVLVNNGYRIYRAENDGLGGLVWLQHRFGGEGTMLAAPNGGLWHINSVGDIYREGPSGWEWIDGQASVIAGFEDEVWHLSKGVTRGTRDHDLYRWNGGGWDWVAGKAADLAVTRNQVNDQMEVWYTNERGQVYRQPVGGSAKLMPALDRGACGISTGADGSVFALQCPFNANGMPVYVYNYQKEQDRSGTSSDTPPRNQWTRVEGTWARDVTSSLLGKIWHVGTNGLYASK